MDNEKCVCGGGTGKKTEDCKRCGKRCLYYDINEIGDDIKAALILTPILLATIIGLYFLLKWVLPPELWERFLRIIEWA